jgi:hypothetical protein
MCGLYRRHSDKQRIAELFAASAELEELYFGPESLKPTRGSGYEWRDVAGRADFCRNRRLGLDSGYPRSR